MLDQESYMFPDLTLVAGDVANAISLTCKRNPVFKSRRVGKVDQQVYSHEDKPDIMIEGYNTGDFNFGSIVPNDPVPGFALTSDNDANASVLGNLLTVFPVSGMVFGAPETGWDQENPSKWRVPIECNLLNPNV